MNAVSGRRSIHSLIATLPAYASQEKLIALIRETIRESPTAFSSQSVRAVALHGAESQKVWQAVKDAMAGLNLPADQLKASYAKIDGCFASGAGTILFYEDTAAIKAQQEQFPAYADGFPVWSRPRARSVIEMLLVIGGVERNPGPAAVNPAMVRWMSGVEDTLDQVRGALRQLVGPPGDSRLSHDPSGGWLRPCNTWADAVRPAAAAWPHSPVRADTPPGVGPQPFHYGGAYWIPPPGAGPRWNQNKLRKLQNKEERSRTQPKPLSKKAATAQPQKAAPKKSEKQTPRQLPQPTAKEAKKKSAKEARKEAPQQSKKPTRAQAQKQAQASLPKQSQKRKAKGAPEQSARGGKGKKTPHAALTPRRAATPEPKRSKTDESLRRKAAAQREEITSLQRKLHEARSFGQEAVSLKAEVQNLREQLDKRPEVPPPREVEDPEVILSLWHQLRAARARETSWAEAVPDGPDPGASLLGALRDRDAEIQRLQSVLQEINATVDTLRSTLEERERSLVDLHARSQSELEAIAQKAALGPDEPSVASLQARVHELEAALVRADQQQAAARPGRGGARTPLAASYRSTMHELLSLQEKQAYLSLPQQRVQGPAAAPLGDLDGDLAVAGEASRAVEEAEQLGRSGVEREEEFARSHLHQLDAISRLYVTRTALLSSVREARQQAPAAPCEQAVTRLAAAQAALARSKVAHEATLATQRDDHTRELCRVQVAALEQAEEMARSRMEYAEGAARVHIGQMVLLSRRSVESVSRLSLRHQEQLELLSCEHQSAREEWARSREALEAHLAAAKERYDTSLADMTQRHTAELHCLRATSGDADGALRDARTRATKDHARWLEERTALQAAQQSLEYRVSDLAASLDRSQSDLRGLEQRYADLQRLSGATAECLRAAFHQTLEEKAQVARETGVQLVVARQETAQAETERDVLRLRARDAQLMLEDREAVITRQTQELVHSEVGRCYAEDLAHHLSSSNAQYQERLQGYRQLLMDQTRACCQANAAVTAYQAELGQWEHDGAQAHRAITDMVGQHQALTRPEFRGTLALAMCYTRQFLTFVQQQRFPPHPEAALRHLCALLCSLTVGFPSSEVQVIVGVVQTVIRMSCGASLASVMSTYQYAEADLAACDPAPFLPASPLCDLPSTDPRFSLPLRLQDLSRARDSEDHTPAKYPRLEWGNEQGAGCEEMSDS